MKEFFQRITSGLPEVPRFNFFSFDDVNPVSGRNKRRAVAAPNEAMKKLQRKFMQYLRSDENQAERKRLLHYAVSSNPGDSPLRNARQHQRNRYFYLIDFSNAYRNVDVAKLANILAGLKIFRIIPAEEIQGFLQKYFFDERCGLVPGGNASQDLFNLYAGALADIPLDDIVKKLGITYTRYIDDLTFSSPMPIPEGIRKEIRDTLIRAGFKINHRKCECIDLKKRTVIVTGIGIAYGERLFVPRPYARKVRGLIHLARTNRDAKVIQRIAGMMQTTHQICGVQKSTNAFERKVFEEYKAIFK